MNNHTPTPWKWDGNWLEGNGETILWYTSNDDGVHCKPYNSAFIVKAVNCHDSLVEILNALCAMEIKGHSLIDRLQFSEEGRQLSKKIMAILPKQVAHD